MNEEPKPQWAVIELMGHVKTAGLVTKDTEYGTPLLRVDVPNGDAVMTQYINPQSIYRMTLVEERIARAVAGGVNCKPVSAWELRQLAAPVSDDAEPEPDGDDDDSDFP